MPSEPVYWPATLPLPLRQPAFSLSPRHEVTQMDTKRIRVRKYHVDYLAIYDFEWNFTKDEFEAFKSFFEVDLCNGADAFTIQVLDPDDSTQLKITDFGFFENTYSWTHTDGVYNVQARVVIEAEEIEALEEPFDPITCEVNPPVYPPVSDGEVGGNTFECYAVGDYTITAMQLAGTGISDINHGNGSFGFIGGEDFETFGTGDLVLGSPSSGSFLVLMRYGDSPYGIYGGDDFDDESTGAYSPGLYPMGSVLVTSFSGDG